MENLGVVVIMCTLIVGVSAAMIVDRICEYKENKND